MPDASLSIDGTTVISKTSGNISIDNINTIKLPAGHIVRVFHKTSTADITVTSGTTIVTGVTQTLTPLSNTSKFLILYNFSGRFNSGSDTVFHVDIYYEGSAIGGKTQLNNFSSGNVNFPVSGAGSFLHSPSTASEITYDIRLKLFFGSGSCTLTDECSQMTIQEIAGSIWQH